MTRYGFSSIENLGVWDSTDAVMVDGGKTPVWKCSKCGTVLYGSDIAFQFCLAAAGRYTDIRCSNYRECGHRDKIGNYRSYGLKNRPGSEYADKIQVARLKEKFRKLFIRF